VDSCDSGWGPVAGFPGHGNKTLVQQKPGNFLYNILRNLLYRVQLISML
jgi:hypothetical protein